MITKKIFFFKWGHFFQKLVVGFIGSNTFFCPHKSASFFFFFFFFFFLAFVFFVLFFLAIFQVWENYFADNWVMHLSLYCFSFLFFFLFFKFFIHFFFLLYNSSKDVAKSILNDIVQVTKIKSRFPELIYSKGDYSVIFLCCDWREIITLLFLFVALCNFFSLVRVTRFFFLKSLWNDSSNNRRSTCVLFHVC